MSDENEMAMLLGRTVGRVEGAARYSESLTLHFEDGARFSMFHVPDCCETVQIEEIVGDITDLIGSPLLMAECVVSEGETPEAYTPPEGAYLGESYTWTFYKFATHKGYVTLRWLGSSNGYYSERVATYFEATTPIIASTQVER